MNKLEPFASYFTYKPKRELQKGRCNFIKQFLTRYALFNTEGLNFIIVLGKKWKAPLHSLQRCMLHDVILQIHYKWPESKLNR